MKRNLDNLYSKLLLLYLNSEESFGDQNGLLNYIFNTKGMCVKQQTLKNCQRCWVHAEKRLSVHGNNEAVEAVVSMYN